ncbi:MAG: TniQ family protein [Holophagaceae bacterium]
MNSTILNGGLEPLLQRPKWLWRVSLQPGESLTSLVCRQSRLCEMKPAQLLRSAHLPAGVELGDMDVTTDTHFLQELSHRLGVSFLDLQRCTLRDYQSAILPPALRASQMGSHRLPRLRQWILPYGWMFDNGVNHPRAGGIPYCPYCFGESEDPWFPLVNRFALTVVCRQHRVFLWDSCPKCRAPLSPFQLLKEGDWTFAAKTDLCLNCKRTPGTFLPQEDLHSSIQLAPPGLVRFQVVLISALSGESIEVPQVERMPAARFLAGLRHCLTAARFLLDLGIKAGYGVESLLTGTPGQLFGSKSNASIEFLSLSDRVETIQWLGWFFDAPLDRWHQVLGMPNAPRDLKKRARHPWEHIDDNGAHLERTTALGKSYHRYQANPVDAVSRFFDATALLGLTQDVVRSLLGGISEKKYLNWRHRPGLTIPANSRHRMEHFLRIWDGATTLFGSEEGAKKWLLATNRHPLMQGLPPVYFLARDPDGSRFEFVSELIGRRD